MTGFEGMRVYDGGRAPNPRRVQIFMAEKGIEIERVHVDINRLEQYSDAFSQINPMNRVPVLVLADGTAIAETVAICRYLEALQPEPRLMGTDPLDIALVEMWQRRVEIGLLMPVAFVFRHLHPGAAHLEQPQVAEWGEANRPRVLDFLSFLDGRLARTPFMAGDRFTIADITAFVACQFMKPARIEFPADLENLSRWFATVKGRPSTAWRD